ncbi:MAG TPA: hypothetical protein VK698_01810 [Kofleriaceae bacterium]|nr:hypothetical protein [Kofleriaceae bacterium]
MPRAVTMTVVLGALGCALALALGTVGCAEDGSGKSADKVSVGRVVEVSGSVTAAREGASPRPLHRDDPVFRDDTVKTAADGEVTIVLAHNDARWSLAGGKSRRVDRSPAWRAERGQGSGSAFDDEEALPTSSAGRHSEPQVGDTRATAPVPKAEAEDSEMRVAESTDEKRPARGARPRHKSSTAGDTGGAGGASGASAGDEAPGGGLALGAVPIPPAEGSASGGGNGAGAGSAAKGAAPLRIAGTRRASLGALSVSGSRTKGEIGADVGRALGDAAQLCAIGASSAGTVKVRFDIGRKGNATRIRVSGPAGLVGQVRACLEKQVGGASFASRKEGTTHVSQSIRFAVP